MNTIKEIKNNAFWRFIYGYGYNYNIRKSLWQSKKCSWNWVSLTYGIRNSSLFQIFPIWNMSNNCERSLLFGFGFWYFQLTYHKRYAVKISKLESDYYNTFDYNNFVWRFFRLIS